ncbi:carcinoembryonic antigen-related cell adhesion molecule 7-like [Acanthopagrus latus]|uniref:carcinoembryonic antigen-related cell adhesion molecule 7-like n=1 Tax=Acanthopagrus latus TaxID=8177 RepID=UPI00187C1053|nr:carcinoembryonic antigen-related cell adhesion molecule 7-like [Acanthopagrus latus]
MMRVAGWACVLLAVVSADPEKTLYKKVGDEVVLRPDAASVTGPITSITWKEGPNLAMQWDGTDIDKYRHFKERGSLNISNGAMMITGLTRGDSELYTVEINGGGAGSTRLTVISPVPTPSVTKSCDDETSCVLTCDGNTTGTDPFTYTWHLGAIVSNDASKEQRITKDNHSSVEEFSCMLKNPVSEERSQPITNPFITPPETPAAGNLKITTALTVFICLLAPVLVLVLIHRWKAGMWFFQEESMPWEAGFWSRQERPPREAAESNGTTARREKGEAEEETPMA